MVLGVSYNVFDSVDLLEESITRIRNEVDYVSVVFQSISNYGRAAKTSDIMILEDLRKRGLISHYIDVSVAPEYTNIFADPSISVHSKEQFKRNIGLVQCREMGCTHFMSMDCDEYYLPQQFICAKAKIIAFNITNSACQLLTYYGDKKHILEEYETYVVPFICKLAPDSKYMFQSSYPYYCDPTRRISTVATTNSYVFNRAELEMHHLSYVRSDLRQKLENSSAKVNFDNPIQISNIVKYYDGWINSDPHIDKNMGLFTSGLKRLTRVNYL